MHTESEPSTQRTKDGAWIPRLGIIACAVAGVGIASCVNPFAVDTAPLHPDGQGGTISVNTGQGGKGMGGKPAGVGGNTGTPDAGNPDSVVVEEPEPVQPHELFPTIPQCPADIVDEEAEGITCPRALTEIVGWLPVTPPMERGGGCLPLPHPAGECQFYQQSFQEFMIATQPDMATGKPAFLGWNTIENTFGQGRGKPTPAIPVLTAGVTQAGGRQVVIDQNGNALYYAIHMNKAFVDFVEEAHLTSADQIQRANPDIHFTTTAAIVETKEAWMIVPPGNTTIAQNFITTQAMVPTLSVDAQAGVVADDAHLRQVTVALIAIHIVHTIPGHPEFVWSTFQHTNRTTGVTDLAPSAGILPRDDPPADQLTTILQPQATYLLYTSNTLPNKANSGVFLPEMDVATQKFITPPTSIYRVFPAAKTATDEIDGDIDLLNAAMQDRFNTVTPRPYASDRRPWYRLVGAVWLDRPARSFRVNSVLVNDPNDPDVLMNGSDAVSSINGGEDGLSSTAMESFTQGPAEFPTCFSCHDTQSTSGKGVPQPRDLSPVVMKPGLINVSHIFNEVVRLNIN